MNVRQVESWQAVKAHLGLAADGRLLEPDLDVVDNETELYSRKRRDAEVLTLIAANSVGDALDIGTSHGRSAFKLATNLPAGRLVFTVNILPEQMDGSSGRLITHVLTREEIGVYCREHDIQNVRQTYANTATWDIPAHIDNLGMVFVDGAHDTENVYADSRKAYARLAEGGFILWHDFSPGLRATFDWIDACMKGVERFCADEGIEADILHLRDSWIGILRKEDRLQPRVAGPHESWGSDGLLGS